MLYYLFEYLENQYQIPGASLFTYISFRAAAAVITSLLISTIFGRKIINFLNQNWLGTNPVYMPIGEIDPIKKLLFFLFLILG